MEKKQYELLVKVLRRLQENGVLDKLILTGSWGLVLYRKYFESPGFYAALRTRDVDFIVPSRPEIRKKVDVSELLKDLGFVVEFNRADNSMRLLHPALIVEFLVAEKGRGSVKSRKIKELGVTAQPLRYLNYLESKIISIDIEGLNIRVPDPAVFALHKLIIMSRRRTPEKKEKDKKQAKTVLGFLLANGRDEEIRDAIRLMHPKWFQTIMNNLEKENEVELKKDIEILAG